MTIAWMMYVLLVGALLAGGAGCVEAIFRAAKRPARWVWAAAMLGTVGFAAYALRNVATTEAAVEQVPVKVSTMVATASPSAPGLLASIDAWRASVTHALASGIGAMSTHVPQNLVALALGIWAAASIMLLVVHLTMSRAVIRQRRAWPVAELPGGTARVAPALGPAVIGLASPEIVVPQWLLRKSEEEQRLVMVHEQEHIAARDQFLPFGALLVATLLPWHPAVWWSLARLRLAVELDCDARVLRRGVRAKPYGTLLIDIAAQCGGHRVGAVALADRTSHLERRILAMTPRTSRLTRVRSIGLAAVAAAAFVTACEARLPTSSEVQAMDVAATEKALVQTTILDQRALDNVIYLVDGKEVTTAQAHAIPANRIATVNVHKAEKDAAGHSGLNHVAIITTDAINADLQRTKTTANGDGAPMKVYVQTGQPFLETPKGNLQMKTKFDGLLYVDGVRAPEDALSKIKPDDIASIDILKGQAARAFSSDAASANGIIKVTTKAAATKVAP
jgi:hypothetical protein